MASGALLGPIAYSTYDLTNLATLRGWSAKLALINLAWGTIVTRLAATAGCFGARSFSGVAAKLS